MNNSALSRHIIDINKFSEDTFDLLSRAFLYKLSIGETGITDMLILKLTEINQYFKRLYIYKSNTDVEYILGNDIDIYLEVSSDQYVCLTFQAKVLNHNGRFNELKFKKDKNKLDDIPQWEKLMFHEYIFNSKAFYLLYIGEPNNRKPNIPNSVKKSHDCFGDLYTNQIGISIIQLNAIINLRLGKKDSAYIKLSEILRSKFNPFRSLFCEDFIKNLNLNSLKRYSKKDLGLTSYTKINKESKEGDLKERQIFSNSKDKEYKLEEYEERYSLEYSRPKYKILIHRKNEQS